jgi:PAS domain S-box-containing protein
MQQRKDFSNKEEEKFRKIFEYSNDAIFIIDPDEDRILDVNSSACEMLGYSNKELLHLPVSAIHPHELPALMKFVKSVYKKENGWTNELSCLTKIGKLLPSEISASVIDIDGKSCIIALIRDISQRKEAELKLKQMNEELEARVAQRTAEISEANQKLQNALTEVERLKNRLEAENIYLQEEIKLNHNFEDIITGSHELKRVLRKVEQVASTDATVLILGETGTGKELFTRAIHNISRRRDRPLVKVNCAALPANLIESELFGHEKGAFTGALSRKIGRFELADEATLFLDEIGDLPLELQAKLLRVLQDGEFERLGNSNTMKVNVRVIAATNRDLTEATKIKTFREDLFYRLNVFPILIPPLRERKDDIPVLVKHLLQKHSVRIGKKIEIIPQKVIDKLVLYHWPGNVRELENIIERAVIISPGNELRLGDWLAKSDELNESGQVQTLEQIEKEHIVEILKMTGWRVSGEKGAAKLLGIKPPTLVSRMKKLGIERN